MLDFIGANDDGSGGDNWNYKTCKAPVKMSPPTNKNPDFFTRQMPFQLPNQQCQSTEGIKNSTCPSDEIITLMIPLVIIT